MLEIKLLCNINKKCYKKKITSLFQIVVSFLIACLLNVVCSQINEDLSYTKYRFGFENADPGHHTRLEESDAAGHVSGMYSYVDPNGVLRTVRYNSAPGIGYQVYGDGITRFGSETMPAILEKYSTPVPVEYTKSDAELIASGGSPSQNLQIVEAKPDEEFANTATPLQNLQVVNANSNEEISSSGVDSLNFQVMEAKFDEERPASGSIPTLESVVMGDDITNDTQLTFVDVTNSSSAETDNSTFVEDKMIPENTGSLPPSNPVFVNHNRLFPYLFPFSSYNFPLNSLPYVYALPHAFTYNVLAPHYQLIL